MPMLPLAPGLLSMTNAWPSVFCSSPVRMRQMLSGEPPAAEGTTRRIGRSGQAARASRGDEARATAPSLRTFRRVVFSPVIRHLGVDQWDINETNMRQTNDALTRLKLQTTISPSFMIFTHA